MLRLVFVVVPLIAFAGCQKENAAFCPGHPGQEGCPPDATTGGPCRDSNDCMDKVSFPVCDTADNGGTCVQCTLNEHAACTGVTPICDGRTCAACVNDSDCGTGGLCLPSGACAASDSIIHATVNGAAAPPCGSTSTPCMLNVALAAVDATKNVIKLDEAGPYAPNGAPNYNVAKNVTIDARGATLHKVVDGPILSISDNTSATIVGGIIEGAQGPNGDGIKCGTSSTLAVYGTIIQSNTTFGIDAAGCSTVTLSRSQILSNKRGGVTNVNGKFAIVGNVFANNGDANNPNTSVKISTDLDPMNRLEFNTIANNSAQAGVNAGLDCIAGTGFTAHDNIIWNNTGVIQISGTCMHSYSDIGPLAVLVSGTGNKKDDPMLTGTWHLGTGSPALGGADPQADLNGIAAKDIDGDPRVAPADMGADQLPRP